MSRWKTVLTSVVTSAALALGSAQGAENDLGWPAWRGADRTGVSSKETGLLKQWPSEGPKLAWKIENLGDGYSTPSITGGKIYVMGTKESMAGGGKGKGKGGGGGTDEFLFALAEKDGKMLWNAQIGKTAGGYPGPRSTPTIDGANAYVISSDGILACVAIDKGTIVWKKSFKSDFGGSHGSWAYAESPLIDGDWVVCCPGADKAAMVALNKKTGNVVWKCEVTKAAGKRPYAQASYSSTIVAELAGNKTYVNFVSGGVIGVNAKDGKLLWSYDAPANGTANCSTPIAQGNAVFAISAYGNGGGLAEITKDGAEYKATEKYFVKKFQNHHGGVLLIKDHIYGTSGGSLMCMDIKDGKVTWDERSVGKGSIAYADGMLYVRGEDGKVALVEPNPEKYVEKGMFSQPERSSQKAWAHPVIVNGKLYLRDWNKLLVYEVKK